MIGTILAVSITGLIVVFFNQIIGFLPLADPTIVTYISSKVSSFNSYFDTAGWFFPLNDFKIVMGFIFLLESALFTFRVGKWIAKMLSGGLIK